MRRTLSGGGKGRPMGKLVRHRVHRLVWLGIALALVGCYHQPPLVLHMGPPHDRYDHNRTRLIVSPAVREGRPTKVIEEAYTPGGHDAFPRARYEPVVTAPDGMPAAGV